MKKDFHSESTLKINVEASSDARCDLQVICGNSIFLGELNRELLFEQKSNKTCLVVIAELKLRQVETIGGHVFVVTAFGVLNSPTLHFRNHLTSITDTGYGNCWCCCKHISTFMWTVLFKWLNL
ncbi:Hypothetical predicted protein [Olea europaea subsp. europaea]|uniref:Uncharacterized protein n=1 Tax=Olea europaea subsp. europaea TaxID=158383 RepID=A0A8S0UZF1_OLEEU|nr:Hypothetical predicted protein [Olea europaea subsp. europaea]